MSSKRNSSHLGHLDTHPKKYRIADSFRRMFQNNHRHVTEDGCTVSLGLPYELISKHEKLVSSYRQFLNSQRSDIVIEEIDNILPIVGNVQESAQLPAETNPSSKTTAAQETMEIRVSAKCVSPVAISGDQDVEVLIDPKHVYERTVKDMKIATSNDDKTTEDISSVITIKPEVTLFETVPIEVAPSFVNASDTIFSSRKDKKEHFIQQQSADTFPLNEDVRKLPNTLSQVEKKTMPLLSADRQNVNNVSNTVIKTLQVSPETTELIPSEIEQSSSVLLSPVTIKKENDNVKHTAETVRRSDLLSNLHWSRSSDLSSKLGDILLRTQECSNLLLQFFDGIINSGLNVQH